MTPVPTAPPVPSPEGSRRGHSLLADARFYGAALITFGLGHILDLAGTYIAQPHFENEANPIHNVLVSRGIFLGWPGAIMGKLIFWLLVAWALRLFLQRRHRYYPKPGANFREFITFAFYGRSLRWVETLYRLPYKSHWLLCLLSSGTALCLTGPYFAYLGYANLAYKYGWPRLGGFYIGMLWVEHALVLCVLWAVICLGWLLWKDYQDYQPGVEAHTNLGRELDPSPTLA